MRTCVYKSSILLFSAFLDVIFFRKKAPLLILINEGKGEGLYMF